MDLKTLLSARRSRLGTLSGAGVLVLAAGLSLANLLAQRLFLRLDWTEGGRYSLSPASRKLVRELPDPLLVRAYVSKGLAQPYGAYARYLEDLLGEYRAAGRGRVKVEVLDPEGSEKVKADAQKAGVIPARFTQVASDQFQIREGFLGVALFYQDKQEVLPFVKETGALEYEITTRLRKMSRQGKKVLGVVTGQGETPPQALQEGVGVRLSDAFELTPFTLASSTAPPDVLFVVDPKGEFTPEALEALDALVSSGVPTAFFVSRKTVALQSFRAFPRKTGLEDFLAHYGARLGEELLLDAQCQQVTVQSRQGGYTVANIINYPAFVLSRPEDHPLTRSLEALAFPFAHPVYPAAGGGLKVTPLARSSPHSWAPAELSSVDPYQIRRAAPEDARGPFVLAALVEGSTVSFRHPERPARVRLAVVGTGSFADHNLPLVPGNADFLSNLAEWMVQEKDFMAVPVRGEAFRPLRKVPAPLRALVKGAGFFVLPSAMVLWGLARWRRRRARRPLVEKEWKAAAGA